jgi:hypothetical protein
MASRKELTLPLLDDSALQQRKVTEKAQLWEKYANIHLDFGSDPDAEIRISFTADPGSWSAVGTDALIDRYFPKFQPTMNFGWLRTTQTTPSTNGLLYTSSDMPLAASTNIRARARHSSGTSPKYTGCLADHQTTGRQR